MSVTHLVRTQLEAFKSTANTAVTIGVLDGVHLGHQALLKCLYDEASQKNVTKIIKTLPKNIKKHTKIINEKTQNL